MLHVVNAEVVRLHLDDLFDIEIVNSDYFFNMAIVCNRGDWLRAGRLQFHMPNDRMKQHSPYPNIPLHGLLGQTWRNVKYANGHVYEGDIMDYAAEEKDIYFVDFMYNQYKKGHSLAHSKHHH